MAYFDCYNGLRVVTKMNVVHKITYKTETVSLYVQMGPPNVMKCAQVAWMVRY